MRSVDGKNTGSTLAADEWNQSGAATEPQNMVESAGITLDNLNQTQMAEASAVYAARSTFYTDVGAANAYVLDKQANILAPKAYGNGMLARFEATNTNTGPSTVNVNTIGTKQIRVNGVALSGSEIVNGSQIELTFDSSNDWFSLTNVSNTTSPVFQSIVIGNAIVQDLVFGNFRMTGTDFASSVMSLARYSADASPPNFSITKSRGPAVGGVDTVIAGDVGFNMNIHYSDGVDLATIGGALKNVVTSVVGGVIKTEWQFVDHLVVPTFRFGRIDGVTGDYVIFGDITTDPADFDLNYDHRLLISGTSAAIGWQDVENSKLWVWQTATDDFILRDESSTDGSPATGTRDKWLVDSATAFWGPGSDGIQDLGASGNRCQDIWATNNVIQTSDERWKEQFEPLSKDQIAAFGAVQLTTFKWKDAVKDKGDAARRHVGINAQQAVQAFEDAGLDPFELGVMGKDAYFKERRFEVQKSDGTVEQKKEKIPQMDADGNQIERLNARYNQLLLGKCAFLEQENAGSKKALAAMIKRVAALEKALKNA